MALADQIHLEIVTPYDLFFDGYVDMVIVTAKDGEIGILPGHTAVMAALRPGEIRFKIGNEQKVAATTNGYAEIAADRTIVVVNAAEWATDIDLSRAKDSLSRAEKRLSNHESEPLDKSHAQHAIVRARNRIKVATDHAGPAKKKTVV